MHTKAGIVIDNINFLAEDIVLGIAYHVWL